MKTFVVHSKTSLVCLMLGLLLCSSGLAQEVSTPYIDADNIAVLTTEEQGWLFRAQLAPSGNYVATVSQTETERFIHVWDVGFSHQSIPTLPVHSVQLEGDQRTDASTAFSLDGQYLAVGFNDGDVQLWSVPDWRVVKSISVAAVTGFGFLSWHSDGTVLAILQGGELIVWDVVTDDVYRRDDLRGFLYSFGDEWFIRVPSRHTFTFCTLRLEQCNMYEYRANTWAIAPQRQVLVVRYRNETGQHVVGVWTHTAPAQYTVDEESLAAVSDQLSPRDFSPSGRYLSTGSTIWDLSTLEPIQSIIGGMQYELVWLSQDEFLITLSTVPPELEGQPEAFGLNLRLYRLGQEEPVEVVGINQIGAVDTRSFLDPESIGIVGVSSDGRWVLVSLGTGLLVVPIVYE